MKGFIIVCVIIFPFTTHSQNMGIGLTNPSRAKLEINGVSGVGTTSAIFGGESSGLSFQRGWPTIGYNQYKDNVSGNGRYMANGFAARQHVDPANGNMYFDVFPYGNANSAVISAVRGLSIGNNSNVAVRADPADASLYVPRLTNPEGSVVLGGTHIHSYFNYGADEHTYIRGGADGSRVFLNDIPSGRVILGGGTTMVGINSGEPTYTLEIRQVSKKGLFLIESGPDFNNWAINNQEYYVGQFSNLVFFRNGVGKAAIYPNGNMYQLASDVRMKTGIQELPPVLKKLKQIHPSTYQMKDNNENRETTFGFIAQEVKRFFPELVRVNKISTDAKNKFSDLHTVSYTGLSIIVIKALQEQYDQIKALQMENDDLGKQLSQLEEIIQENK